MLATSNVPVWAAEFSDGSDADVAITSEAPVAEDTDAADAAAFSDEATPEVTENTDDIADTATAANRKSIIILRKLKLVNQFHLQTTVY